MPRYTAILLSPAMVFTFVIPYNVIHRYVNTSYINLRYVNLRYEWLFSNWPFFCSGNIGRNFCSGNFNCILVLQDVNTTQPGSEPSPRLIPTVRWTIMVSTKLLGSGAANVWCVGIIIEGFSLWVPGQVELDSSVPAVGSRYAALDPALISSILRCPGASCFPLPCSGRPAESFNCLLYTGSSKRVSEARDSVIAVVYPRSRRASERDKIERSSEMILEVWWGGCGWGWWGGGWWAWECICDGLGGGDVLVSWWQPSA